MRPIRLIIDGINSYYTKQEVDFEKLISKGLFGIFGKTGCGKSTILDSITLALYGKIPRDSKEFINLKRDKAYVEYEFEIGSGSECKRYQVSRRYKRTKQNTTATDRARLMVRNEFGEYDVVEEGAGRVDACVKEIIGLECDDFLKSVVLPQGKFSEFMTIKDRQRREMLERIFDLNNYGSGLNKKISLYKREVLGKIQVLEGRLGEYAGIDEKYKVDLESKVNTLNKALENISKILIDEEKKSTEYSEIYSLQEEKLAIDKQKSELEKIKSDIDEMKLRLESHTKAIVIKPTIDRLYAVSKEKVELTTSLEDTEKKYGESEQDFEKSKEKLEKFEARRNGILEVVDLRRDMNDLADLIDEMKKQKLVLSECSKNFSEYKIMLNEMEKEEEKFSNKLAEIEEKGISLRNYIDAYNDKFQDRFNLKSAYDLFVELKKITDDLVYDFKNRADVLKKYNDLSSQLEKLKKEENKLNFSTMVDKVREIMASENLTCCPVCNNKITDICEEHCDDRRLDIDENFSDNEKISLNNEDKYSDIDVLNNDDRYSGIDVLNNDDKYSDIEGLNEVIEKLSAEVELHKNYMVKYDTLIENKEENIKSILDKIKDIAEKNLFIDVEKINFNISVEGYGENEDDYLKSLCDQVLREEAEFKKISSKRDDLRKEYTDEKEKKDTIIKKKQALNDEIIKLKANEESADKIIKSLVDKKINLEKNIDFKKVVTITNDDEFIYDKAVFCNNEIIASDEIINNNEIAASNEIVDNNKIVASNEIVDNKVSSNKLGDSNAFVNIEDSIYLRKVSNVIFQYEKFVDEGYNSTKSNHDFFKEKFEKLKDMLNRLKTELLAKEELEKSLYEDVESMMKKSGFISIEDVLNRCLSELEFKKFKKEVENYDNDYQSLIVKEEICLSKLGNRSIDTDVFEEQIKRCKDLTDEKNSINEEFISTKNTLKDIEDKLIKIEEINVELKKNKVDFDNVKVIDDLFKGNKFVEYLSQLYLKNIVIDASQRLYNISNGAYTLEIDDSYQFVVCDNLNGGVRRSTKTLSGGEIFLASLSLALALSSQIQMRGNAALEFFFLDEGFGTLDSELLDTVMESLESLHSETLNVGIISHVEEIKERIPMKLNVEMNEAEMTSKIKLVES